MGFNNVSENMEMLRDALGRAKGKIPLLCEQ